MFWGPRAGCGSTELAEVLCYGALMSPFSIGRAKILLVVIASLLIGMIGRVAYLQTYGRQKTIRWAERQQHTAIRSIAA